MFRVFEDVRLGKYVRNIVTQEAPAANKKQLEKLEGPLTAGGDEIVLFDLEIYRKIPYY